MPSITHSLWWRRAGLLVMTLSLWGCATPSLVFTDTPSEPPPQIAYLGARDAQGQQYKTWLNVMSFARVPAELQAVGDLSCMQNGLELRATGYHPRARDLQGNTVPGGGFFCQLAVLSGATNSAPPQVVMRAGQAGWDRPGAFGAIPADKQAQAEAQCQKGNPKAKPLAYHPRPLDIQGQPMTQGGFLCVE